MAVALQQERAQYEEHVQQLEAHHASLQASHQRQIALLTARAERSAQEAADSAARLQEASNAALDRESALTAAREEAQELLLALQAAQDECATLRCAAHRAPSSGGYASPMRMLVPPPDHQGLRTPLGPRMAPQPAIAQQACATTPKATAAPLLRASSKAEEADSPLMQSAGLSPLSPALFALLEGGESPRGDLLTPRVLPQEDYLRLSSAPDSGLQSGHVQPSPIGCSTTHHAPHEQPLQPMYGGMPRASPGRTLPLRASVHGYPTGAPRHVDERVKHWVVADDPSERTTVADPLVR